MILLVYGDFTLSSFVISFICFWSSLFRSCILSAVFANSFKKIGYSSHISIGWWSHFYVKRNVISDQADCIFWLFKVASVIFTLFKPCKNFVICLFNFPYSVLIWQCVCCTLFFKIRCFFAVWYIKARGLPYRGNPRALLCVFYSAFLYHARLMGTFP